MTAKFTEEIKQKIKIEFIEGYLDENNKRIFPSIEALAKRHDVSRATIYRHSNPQQENWQQQKNRFQTKLANETEKQRLSQMIEESRTLNKNSLNIAQALLSRVGTSIAEAMQQARETNEFPLSPTDLRELSHVAEKAQKIGKLALGEAQEITKVSADVSEPESYRSLIKHLEGLANEKARSGEHTIQ